MWRRIVVETKNSGDEKYWRRIIVETNSSGYELLKTSSKETNCLETKSRGTGIYRKYLRKTKTCKIIAKV